MRIKGFGTFLLFCIEGLLKRRWEKRGIKKVKARKLHAVLRNYYEICHLREKKGQKDKANM
jgi:hypothetical protein